MTNLPAQAKAKVVITGDSWSQGEWQTNNETYGICHTGINQYLVDAGYEVTNVGRGGNHDLQSLEALRNIDLTKFDHCVFFFSDVLRLITAKDIAIYSPNDLLEIYTNEIISKLVSLKENTNCKLTVIGGCGKCIPTIEHTIDYLIPSLLEFLINEDDVPYAIGGANWSRILVEQGTALSTEQKQQWCNILDRAFQKEIILQKNNKFFWPDGMHANRHAHKLLTDYLITVWNS